MAIFILAGLMFMGFSFLFFFAPGLIVKMSKIGNKLLFTDYGSVAHPKFSGAVLFIMSLVMLYMGVQL